MSARIRQTLNGTPDPTGLIDSIPCKRIVLTHRATRRVPYEPCGQHPGTGATTATPG